MPLADPKKPGPKAAESKKQTHGEGLAEMFRDIDCDAEQDPPKLPLGSRQESLQDL